MRLEYPQEWGGSNPVRGQISTGEVGSLPIDIRAWSGEGKEEQYRFTVEFTPLSGYGFVEWLAFNSEGYDPAILNGSIDAAKSHASYLNNDIVVIRRGISETGAVTATITITENLGVILVPWCDNRPRLDTRTNPPLTPVQTPFPFDQIINLWFNMPIKPETAVLGESVRITAMHNADTEITLNGTPAAKKRGDPFGLENDGDISNYYNISFPSDNRIDLIPKNTSDYPSMHLTLLNISVSVGPGIENTNDIAMGETQTLSYMTDTTEAQKVYRPQVISASRSIGSGYFQDAGTQWNNAAIDRRFGKDSTVYLQFSVTPPESEGAPPTPNRITIVELQAFTLRGFAGSGNSLETVYDVTDANITFTGGTYTVTHPLKTAAMLNPPSCIIQLIVLPWYEGTGDDTTIRVQEMATAMPEGHFVTIVLDTAAPGIQDLNAQLSPHASIDTASLPGNSIYVFSPSTPFSITIEGLATVADNGLQGGIPVSQAWSLPWTQDDITAIKWHAQIGETGAAGTITEGPFDVFEGSVLNNTWSPDISSLSGATGYRVLVRFEDSLGNISEWHDTNYRVKYSTATINAVSNLEAEVNAAGTSVTVTWIQPATYLYPELVVRRYRATPDGEVFESEIVRNTFGDTKAETGSFTVPVITQNALNGVRSGSAVTGIYGYEISVITHNTAGSAVTGPIWVYNIPGMKVSSEQGTVNSFVKLNQSNFSTALTAANMNFILTEDVELNSWTPLANFTGKFYGNGNTVTIKGINPSANIGLFGIVNNCTVRDLTVQYNNIAVTYNSAVRFGGIAGQALGNTRISNVIAEGKATVTYDSTAQPTPRNELHSGILVGSMEPTAIIENAYAAMELKTIVTENSFCRTYAGGIAGNITGDNGTAVNENTVMIDRVTIVGTVDSSSLRESAIESSIYLGGVVGSSFGKGLIRDAEVKGTLKMFVDSTATSTTTDFILGGIVGRMKDGHILNSHFTGEIVLPETYRVRRQTFIGGLAGTVGTIDNSTLISTQITANVTVKRSTARGNISVTAINDGKMIIGGIAGSSSNYIHNTSNQTPYTITFEDCEYYDGDIIFSKTGPSGGLNIGGFIGDGVRGTEFTNCSARVGLINVSYKTTNINQIQIGGFAGVMRGNIDRCYSTSSIELVLDPSTNSGSSNIHVGGFVGTFINDYKISRCYSTGSVTVTSLSAESRLFRVGGFVGRHEGNTTIEDCYSTGNVMADKAVGSSGTGNMDIGGFSSSIAGDNIEISRCFTTGSVTAKRNDSGYMLIAGLVGYQENNRNSINNSVALNPFVTMQPSGGNNRTVNRIFSNVNVSGGSSGTNNYAVDTLKLYTSDTYNSFILTEQVPSTTGGSTMNGETISRASLTAAFWRSLGFDDAVWDLGTPVTRNGWPTLRGVGGQ